MGSPSQDASALCRLSGSGLEATLSTTRPERDGIEGYAEPNPDRSAQGGGAVSLASRQSWQGHLGRLRRPRTWLALVAFISGALPALATTDTDPAVVIGLGLAALASVASSGEFDSSLSARRGLGPRWAIVARNLAVVLLVFITVAMIGGVRTASVALVATWLVAPPLYLAGAVMTRRVLHTGQTRTVLVGSGEVARRAIETTSRHPELGIKIVGMVDDPPPSRDLDLERDFAVGDLDDLPDFVHQLGARSVLVGYSLRSDRELVEVIRRCDDLGVSVAVVPRLFDLIGPPPSDLALGALGSVAFRGRPPGWFARGLKRSFDLGVTVLVSIPTGLLVGGAAIAIKLDSSGPVFFRQARIGKNGRQFELLKLRTMVPDAEARVADEVKRLEQEGATSGEIAAATKREDDPRITRVGRFLRKTSIDELPQLWNVFVGEMSIVGPRPLPPREGQGLDGWETTRLDMPPGITGLWQVVGRSSLPWDERMQLDYLYVRNWSLAGDLSIIARTVSTVTRARGAV